MITNINYNVNYIYYSLYQFIHISLYQLFLFVIVYIYKKTDYISLFSYKYKLLQIEI
jgi:hypothetical protein